MPITPDQQAKLDDWYKNVGGGIAVCPHCNRDKFTKSELVKFPLADKFQGQVLSDVYLLQSCAFCRHVRILDARGIGLID